MGYPEGIGKITPLVSAVMHGDLFEVSVWVENYKIDVNRTDWNGDTLLMWAAWCGHLDVTKYLIEHGAHVNTRNNDGNTPLGLAKKGKHTGVAELLIRHGAKE